MLFDLTILPLQMIYLYIYQSILHFIPNYGFALMAMSLVTLILTTPLDKIVAKFILKEKLISSILEPQIKRIKQESKGKEQHQRLRALYQRYGYNPLFTVRKALGVFLQLPFLMAAYWMIKDYAPLNGVSFGFISNLAQEDKLLGGG